MASRWGTGAAGRLALWIPAAAWAGVIWYLSSQPSPPSPVDLPDYVSHAVEFGVLGALVWMGAAGGLPGPVSMGRSAAVAAACILYGALDEFHQRFVPGRDSSLVDLAADAVGVLLAVSVLGLLAAAVRARRSPAGPPRVELLSRRDCHLCDEAEKVLRDLQRDVSFEYVKVDVDGDAELRARYGGEVPVVLLEGRKLFKYRIDPERLRRKLVEKT